MKFINDNEAVNPKVENAERSGATSRNHFNCLMFESVIRIHLFQKYHYAL